MYSFVTRAHAVTQNSFHGGIVMNRKCLFNSQLKVKGMFTRRSCLKDGEQKTRFLEGGWDGKEDEVHEEESLRAEQGRDCYLALSQVCATGGSERKCARKWVYGGSERACVCVCVRAWVCWPAKLATCLSLVVVLVFPFIRPEHHSSHLEQQASCRGVCMPVWVNVSVCVCARVFRSQLA